MAQNLYQIRLPVEHLRHATDMLRYDGAYKVTISLRGEEAIIEATGYTPDRWASFGRIPSKVYPVKVLAKEFTEKRAEACGFTQGLRFFQNWLRIYPNDKFLVEG